MLTVVLLLAVQFHPFPAQPGPSVTCICPAQHPAAAVAAVPALSCCCTAAGLSWKLLITALLLSQAAGAAAGITPGCGLSTACQSAAVNCLCLCLSC